MIEINEEFAVPTAPPRKVWALLSEPESVVTCVPGATLGEKHEDGSFDGSLTVKFGPARVTFRARIELELDEATMSGCVRSRGKDNQGGTRFNATSAFKVVEADGGQPGSRVLINGQTEINGKLAGIVESGAKIVIRRMSSEFAENLAAKCATA